ncbi:MAG TPA: hypothetical protein VEB64_11840 [Azospirillaceae bacterium]|nr:hypothetical protein [Azospirillaceae bacterium]
MGTGKRLAAATLALMVAGCGGPEVVAATGTMMTLASLNLTKKLVADHAVSAATGRDCSLISLEKTGDYCPPPPKPIDRSKVYCYRTIADVDCHTIPDPYRNGARPVADPPLVSPYEADNLKPVIHGAPLDPLTESPKAPVQLSQR